MVRRVFGKANSQDIIFERKEGGRWEVTVPSNLDGEYAVEVYAEDDAGNVAYVCSMVFIICGHELQVKVLDRGFSGKAGTRSFTGTASIGTFLAGLQEGGFTVEHSVCG